MPAPFPGPKLRRRRSNRPASGSAPGRDIGSAEAMVRGRTDGSVGGMSRRPEIDGRSADR
ncbi:MAG TPA: hypothetical protein VMG81_03305 [Thermoplasmata archaeon]|nr:hypothetical protein [Thermoplasmata archaeon]